MPGDGGEVGTRAHALGGLTTFLLLFALTFAVFAPALRNSFLIWDDAGYIWENSHLGGFGLKTLSWAFGDYCCNFWAPLTWVSLAADHAIWGLDPKGYHLTNIILHALNSGLLFLLASQLVRRLWAPDGSKAPELRSYWTSVLAALLFALHPLRVESVAWAAERKDVLSLFFGLPAVMAYLRYATRPNQPASASHRLGFVRSAWYWAAFALFCLSLLSKPMLVSLPAILLLLDWVPLGRFRKGTAPRLLAEKTIFVAVSLVVTLISIDAQRPQAMPLTQAGVASRLLNASKSVVEYLRLTIWPVNISPFYPHPGEIDAGLEHWVYVGILVLITGTCVAFAKRHPELLVTWIAFLGALVPVLGFTQVGPQAMAARFTYFPSVPLSLCTAAVVVTRLSALSARWRAIALALSGSWLIGLSACTVHHLSFWRDDVTLWTRVLDLGPALSARALLERSNGYARRSEPRLALADIEEAITRAPSEKYPEIHELFMARAMILVTLGRIADAIDDYTRALELAKGGVRAEILIYRAALYEAIGNPSAAAADYESATGRRRAP